MYTRIRCRGCSRRLKLPYGADPRKARCPSCGVRVADPDNTGHEATEAKAESHGTSPAADESPPVAQDAKLTTPPVPKCHNNPQQSWSAEAPLSLDDEETILSLDDAEELEPRGLVPSASPPPPAWVGPFPPQRFRAEVLSDRRSKMPISGRMAVVVTPHGLFLEPDEGGFVYVPVGSGAQVIGPGEITLSLGPRRIELKWLKVGNPHRLAQDVAALLAGLPVVIGMRHYRLPPWMAFAALGLGLAVMVGPLIFALAAGLTLKTGLIIGGSLATIALAANLFYLFGMRGSLIARLWLMNGTAAALTALFAVGAVTYARTTSTPIVWREWVLSSPGSSPQNSGNVSAYEAEPLPPPPTYLDLLREKGIVRIPEADNALVTALALQPGQPTLLAGYNDGHIRVWKLDQPTLEDWRPGPSGDGPVKHLRFLNGGQHLLIAGPKSVVLSPMESTVPATLRISGDLIAIGPGTPASRYRFAVLRGNRIQIQVRQFSSGLVANPPGTPVDGFVSLPPKQELPDTTYRTDLAVSNKLTFLSLNGSGTLLGGLADGSVVSWTLRGSMKVENTTHKGPIRAIAYGPTQADLAIGDEKGVVTFWPSKSLLPATLAMLSFPVTALAIDHAGSKVAAGDAAGNVILYAVSPPKEIASFRATGPVTAMAFGPDDESLIYGLGTVIEMRSLDPWLKGSVGDSSAETSPNAGPSPAKPGSLPPSSSPKLPVAERKRP